MEAAQIILLRHQILRRRSQQCDDNGYPNAICTTRQNPDEGVICAQNCSIGYHKAGIFNHTCQACPPGKYNNLWNQHDCQQWSNCLAGQYISANGTSSSDRECTDFSKCPAGSYISTNGTNTADRVCSSCSANQFSSAANQMSCLDWTYCQSGEYVIRHGNATHNRVCESCVGGFTNDTNLNTCYPW